MINIKLSIINKNEIDYLNEFHGMIIHCRDNRKTYYVNQYLNRIDISSNAILVENKSDLYSIDNPILTRVYLVKEKLQVFKYTNRWEQIYTEKELLDIVETSDDYIAGVLYKDNNALAPKTLASAVYLEDGSRLDTVLDSNQITMTKTKAVYVEAEIDNQRVFIIPYPISGYNLYKDHISVIINGKVITTDNYVINNHKLILNSNIKPLLTGELILFIFYYTVNVDVNENVLLTTKNYEDKSITSEKLSSDILIKATNILETPKRYFLSNEEKEKLQSIDYGATRYFHPPTHPASMIVEDEDRQFISEKKKKEIDMKAFSRDVYNKEETDMLLDKLFKKILGSSPEALDTLNELAQALGNDPNFASTILDKLSTKATNDDIKRIDSILETKVNLRDHLRNGVYDTTTKVTVYDTDYYSIKVADEKLREYIDGMPVSIKINETNVGKCLLKINDLDSKPILTQDQYQLIPGELIAGSIYNLRYNGTTGNFILQGKGGVNLSNSTQRMQYIVDKGQKIIRGDLLDKTGDDKVRVSVPRFKLLSNNICDPRKFNCNGKIKLITLNNNRFILFWRENKSVKAYLFTIDEMTNFINGKLDKDPVNICSETLDFEVIKINNNKLIAFYSKDKYNIETMVINIVEDNIVPMSIKAFQESYHIFNLRLIYLKENKFFLGYQFEDKTRLCYCQVIDTKIDILSERTNVDYDITNYCLVNKEQILFSGQIDKELKAWVMNINNLDFNYTTLTRLLFDETEVYKNISYTLLKDNYIYFTYTNSNETIQYANHLKIDLNGDIIFNINNNKIINNNKEKINDNLITKRIPFKNSYVSISNYDLDRPLMQEGNQEYIKFILEDISLKKDKETERLYIQKSLVSKFSILPYKYESIEYDFIDKDKIILLFTVEHNDIYTLYMNIVELKKYPDMIAMTNGISGETIRTFEWK